MLMTDGNSILELMRLGVSVRSVTSGDETRWYIDGVEVKPDDPLYGSVIQLPMLGQSDVGVTYEDVRIQLWKERNYDADVDAAG